MPKVKLYIPDALAGVPLAPWFTPISKGQLFTDGLPPNFFETAIERTQNIEDAAAIVLPNNFRSLTEKEESYIAHFAQQGEVAGVPVYVFSIGDFTDGVRFDTRVTAFKFSVYRSTMYGNEVVIPTSTEDPPDELMYVRDKYEKPVVAFCGMGAFPTILAWVKYFVKNMLNTVASVMQPTVRARKSGVYWRRQMMSACKNSALVATHFIVRRTFSGLSKTIEIDPKVARQEYLEATAHADFVLSPKGDGNYSNRFLKTLAFGRIPVLVDTDTVLPLEEVIDYSKIVVRVPMRDVHNTPRYIADFYNPLSEDEWKARQELARKVYEQYLRQDAFFVYFFSTLPKAKVANLLSK